LSDLDPDGCLVADQQIKEKPDADQTEAVFGPIVVSLQIRISVCDGQVFFVDSRLLMGALRGKKQRPASSTTLAASRAGSAIMTVGRILMGSP